jgi:hypothetical protein
MDRDRLHANFLERPSRRLVAMEVTLRVGISTPVDIYFDTCRHDASRPPFLSVPASLVCFAMIRTSSLEFTFKNFCLVNSPQGANEGQSETVES